MYELYHHGIKGMHWGIRRYRNEDGSLTAAGKRKEKRLKTVVGFLDNRYYKLNKKAIKKDKRSAVMYKRSEKRHSEYDIGAKNKNAMKAARRLKKASRYEKKNEFEKAAKYKYKASKYMIKANTFSRTARYSRKAMKYAIKSDKAKMVAAKARYKMEKNQRWTDLFNTKLSSLTK